MSDAEQDPQIPTVQQDQVGRPAERAEELRRAASSHEADKSDEADQPGEASAPSGNGDRVAAAEPAAAPAAPPGAFDRDSSANLTTADQESGQNDGEWEADASGAIQHTTGGAEGHPEDEEGR
jgi:hypothetical protein